MHMELRNIKSFLKIAECGSFSQAATLLGYAQSTITFQIQQLEEELGYSLFERIGRKNTLTSYGESFLPLARQMINLSEEMHTISKNSKDVAGTIHVGIVESLFASGLVTIFPKFRTLFPNVSLDLKTRPSLELFDELQRNTLDIICCLAPEVPPDNCKIIFSKEIPMAFLASNSVKLPQNKKASLAQIANEEFILTEGNSVYHQALLKAFKEKGLAMRQHCKVESTWAIVNMLIYGNCVSYLPGYVAMDAIKEKKLRVVKTADFASSVDVIVAVHQDKWLSPQMKALMKLFCESSWI